MYGQGISKTGELIDLGVKAGVVEKSGSWFSYDSQRIGQGRENAKLFLVEHADIAHAIEQAVRANAGLVDQGLSLATVTPGGDDGDGPADAAGPADSEAASDASDAPNIPEATEA